MNNNTIKADYTDPKLVSIKTDIAGMNDNTPFLLLPIRVEARFMKTEKKVYTGPAVIDNILEDLIRISYFLKIPSGKLHIAELIKISKDVDKELERTLERLDEVETISSKEKGWLEDQNLEMNKNVEIFSDTIARLKPDNEEEKKQITLLRKQLMDKGNKISKKIESQTINDTKKFLESEEITNSLDQLHDALCDISSKNFSTTVKKEKKNLYSEIDEKIGIVIERTNTISGKHSNKLYASTSQINRIKEINEQIQKEIMGISGSISKLKSNYKRAEYNSRFEDIRKRQLAKLDRQIKEIVLPKLELYLDLKTTDAQKIKYGVLNILYNVKWINDQDEITYKNIQCYSTSIIEQLNDLRSSVHNVIEGTEIDIDAMRNVWEKTDKELVKFARNLENIKCNNKSDREDIARTITLINDEFRKDLNALKKGTKTKILGLTNKDFTNSAFAYEKSLKILGDLHSRFKEHSIGAKKETTFHLLNCLISFGKEFNIISRNIRIIPNEYCLKLKELYMGIRKSFQQLFRNTPYQKLISSGRLKTKNKLIQESEDALNNIEKLINSQVTDISDLNYPLIFSYNTETVDELWVRFYPDDIAIHTHEPALTQEEIDAGKAYWKEIWAGSGDYDLMLGAWRAIVASYGSQRAAWIVKSLDPKLVNNNENTKLFKTKPSLKLSKAIDSLKEIHEELKEIDTNRVISEPISEINFTKLKRDLAKAYDNITSVAEENSLLLQKAWRISRSIQTRLALVSKTLSNTPVNNLPLIRISSDSLYRVLQDWKSFTHKLGSIKGITSKDIIRKKALNIKFPDVEIKETSWSTAPRTKVMPDRFVVLTMQGNTFSHIVVGDKLPEEPLKVGLDPQKFETDYFGYDEEGNLVVDDDLKWMTDYPEALKKGMGITIPLTEQETESGFDKILVLGIKDEDSQSGKEIIEELVDNHHYVDEGCSFLPIGTPTNNTEEGASGYSSIETDDSISFKVERNNERPKEADDSYKTDGQRLAEGLGVKHEVFHNIRYHDQAEISNAITMNKALWPATIGSYMSDILDTLFPLDSIKRTRTFFENYVSGRGILPSIRVGTQPYGILPTTAFSRFNITSGIDILPQLTKEDFQDPIAIESELQLRFDIRMKNLLSLLNTYWTDLMNLHVKHAYNTDIENPQQHFMEMLGLHATSVENYYRYSLNIASRRPTPSDVDFTINFNTEDVYGPDNLFKAFGDFISKGYFYTSDDFEDEQNPTGDLDLQLRKKMNRVRHQIYKSRLFKSRHLSEQAELTGDLIDSQPLSSTNTIEQMDINGKQSTYIAWLLSKSLWTVLKHNDLKSLPSNSILFLLLRQALLVEYRDTALNVLQHEQLTDEKIRRKMGSADYYHTYSPYWKNNTFVTKWTYLFDHLKKLDGLLGFSMDKNSNFYKYMKSRSLSTYLVSPETNDIFKGFTGHANHLPLMKNLDEVKNAIDKLNTISTKKLSQLLAEHIDLCTYRLDAWQLGMANKRLLQQREAKPEGLYIGAYGWLENLRPGGKRKEAQDIPDKLYKEGDAPIYTDEDNEGFIHAPSTNHAVAAAILRAGYISNQATEDLNNHFAINLSSERVRMALNLLEGVRNGQEVGAILGYQFERGLHERYTHLGLELDKYIYAFREEFPLITQVDSSISQTNQTANVVHGLDLLEEAETILEGIDYDNNLSLYEVLKAKVKDHWPWLDQLVDTKEELDAVLKEIDFMANAFDALGDIAISESVYQVVKGNHKRAAVVVSALSEGKNPPEPQIIDTPRSGIVVTHKVVLHLQAISGKDISINDNPNEETLHQRLLDADAIAPGWGHIMTPRAFAEPSVNKWLGEIIGNPENIRCHVEYKLAGEPESIEVTLKNLNMQPLDLLSLMGSGIAEGGSELNNRIAYYVRSSANPKLEKDIEINIKYTYRDISWGLEVKSFHEIAPLIRSLNEIINNSGAVTADDLIIPGETIENEKEIKKQDIEEMLQRITDAQSRIQITYNTLADFYTNEVNNDDINLVTFSEIQISNLRKYLFDLSFFGIPGSIPESAKETTDDIGRDLLRQSQAAYNIAGKKLSQLQEFIDIANNEENIPDLSVNALVDAAKTIFGRSFIIVPHYNLRNAQEIVNQINLPEDKSLLRSADVFAMDTWMQSISKVRKRMDSMQTVSLLSSAFERDFPGMKPIQLPYIEKENEIDNEHWVGIHFPEEYIPDGDKLSVVMINPDSVSIDPEGNKVGLLIDQWVEIIPNKEETTGITFNYDQPDATPPQNLLIAVTPKETGSWNWEDLVYTLIDTLSLAKIRAVEPEHLDKSLFAQVLPSIMSEVVPPQLGDTDGGGESPTNPLGVQVVMDFSVNIPKNEEENGNGE